jgi:hypothetical protein
MNFKLWLYREESEFADGTATIYPTINKEKNNQKTQELAAFYRNNGKYPSTISKIESEKQLGRWLNKRRQAYLGRGSGAAKYEGEEQYGISLGLPNDWVKPQFSEEKLQEKNNQKIRQLAVFYKDNGKYPRQFSKIESEKQLGIWLNGKRQAYQGRSAVGKYEGEKEYGISLGLPNDWLELQITNEKLKLQEKNNQKIQEIASFYRDSGKYPSIGSKIESENQLGRWLADKRQIYLGRGTYAKYEGEEEYGISLGLPNDWLKPQIITTKEEHYDKIRKLAAFYRDNGKYPSVRSKIESEKQLKNWLSSKRQAYQGRGAVAKYEGEKEYGISLGLPNDWLRTKWIRTKNSMNQINQPNIVQNDPEILL